MHALSPAGIFPGRSPVPHCMACDVSLMIWFARGRRKTGGQKYVAARAV